jgi:hypothetical protein
VLWLARAAGALCRFLPRLWCQHAFSLERAPELVTDTRNVYRQGRDKAFIDEQPLGAGATICADLLDRAGRVGGGLCIGHTRP